MGMIQQSIPERDEQLARVVEYIEGNPDGHEITWCAIEKATSVRMNATGRSLVRRALKRSKRQYEPLRGVGIRLSSAETTITIMSSRFVRIDSAVRHADRARRELHARHFDQLDAGDQRRMLTLAGFFGAVSAIAAEHRTKIIKPKALVAAV